MGGSDSPTEYRVVIASIEGWAVGYGDTQQLAEAEAEAKAQEQSE